MKRYEITEDDWKVVEARLKEMPKDLHIGILGKSFDKDGLYNEVKERTDIGEAYAIMELNFLKWIAKQSLVR